MASTRTPASSTIKMSDLDKSIVSGWGGNTANQSLSDYKTSDFNPVSGPPFGFAYCYGNPGSSTPSNLSDFYDILGWVNYRVQAIGVAAADIYVDFSAANGSNGTAPNQAHLQNGVNLPIGQVSNEGAHWETINFTINVTGLAASFNVYLDGAYIDTILADGIYAYVGFTNGYGTSDQVVLLLN